MAYETDAKVNTPKPITAASAIEMFDNVLQRLETIANRACEAGDKIVGSRPSPVAGGEKSVTPNNLIAQIQCRRDRLVNAVDHLESEMQRIENGLA